MTLTEFLLARIAEDERDAYDVDPTWPSRRVLAECEAKRKIIAFHEAWPVLVETQPTYSQDGTTLRMSKQVAWLTDAEYRARFGDDPPSGPMLLALATVYADHPDFRDEWEKDR